MHEFKADAEPFDHSFGELPPTNLEDPFKKMEKRINYSMGSINEILLDFIDWFGTWQIGKNLYNFGINDILDEYKNHKHIQTCKHRTSVEICCPDCESEKQLTENQVSQPNDFNETIKKARKEIFNIRLNKRKDALIVTKDNGHTTVKLGID